jgi:hypothetical protein
LKIPRRENREKFTIPTEKTFRNKDEEVRGEEKR